MVLLFAELVLKNPPEQAIGARIGRIADHVTFDQEHVVFLTSLKNTLS